MATATLSQDAHKKRRAELQQRIKNRDKFKAELDRKAEELKSAEQLVGAHQRTPGYLESFQRAFATAAGAYSDLFNSLPNELRNTCQDRNLKDQFEVAMSIRVEALQTDQQARRNLKRAEADLESTISRISQQRGEPVILEPGEASPWDAGVIQRTLGALKTAIGATETATWAITSDRQNIAFAPSVHPSDVKFYSDQWFDDLRSLRMARAAASATAARLAEAEAALAEVKDLMIWSPI